MINHKVPKRAGEGDVLKMLREQNKGTAVGVGDTLSSQTDTLVGNE